MATNSRKRAAGQAGRTGQASQGVRKAALRSRRSPYQTEIATLARTTAELPSPFRERAINLVAAIVVLFERFRREILNGKRKTEQP